MKKFLQKIESFFYGMPHNYLRYVKWPLQRLFRGHSDCDLWGLSTRIAEFSLRHIKAFRKTKLHGYPSTLDSPEQWEEILDKIIFALENTIDEYCGYKKFEIKAGEYDIKDGQFITLQERKWDEEGYKEHLKKVEEGIELFGKYWRDLWD